MGRTNESTIKQRGWRIGLPKGKYCRLYQVWNVMPDRCRNPKAANFDSYGGRGIAVCPQWSHYSTFRIWAISSGYRKGLSIDRIDNDGDYGPTNCRWATRKEQGRNRRTNVMNEEIVREIRASNKPARYFCDKYGLQRQRIYAVRNNRHWKGIQP